MPQLTTFARPYAKAAFETAVATGELSTWSTGLGVLASLVQQEKVARFLSQPSRSWESQAAGLLGLAGEELDEKIRNFVLLLASNKRLALLVEIVTLFEAMKAEMEKTIDIEVISAFAIDDEASLSLANALKQRLQRDVKLSTSVDKSLIGGLVVKAGDLVIDGSVRAKLNKLSETMNA